jgi:class 3 adenylate cyclase
MRCSRCGTKNRADRRFCSHCGERMVFTCSSCGAPNESGERFCGDCGASLGIDATPDTSNQPSEPGIRLAPNQLDVPGERKTVTALFADLKGSTELIRDLDPERARAIVDPALKIMVDAVRQYDGYVVQTTGDGIFALFGAPLAHEDHPQRALYAALKMQQDLRQFADRLASSDGDRLKPVLRDARVGVNSGEVVMRTVETGGRVEYTPVGYVANLAARLQTVAPAGGIAISVETCRLVEGYFELGSLGPTAIKGLAEPVNIYEVIGPGPLRTHFQLSARRGLTKFVGREEELAQLKRAFELARSGRGQIAAIVAEAGAGKSRLFYEFRATLPAECKLLEAYSVSHGKASAWLPVLELLRGYFGIQDADDAVARREKLSWVVGTLDPALSDTLPYLFALLGIQDTPDSLAQMDPQIKRRRTLDAIKRIALRESLKQSAVIIFEDLHWIDTETQALLDILADSIANARVLLLVNYRPEYRHQWGDKSYYSQLRLEALDGRSIGEMLTTLLGQSNELDPLKRLIMERTEGNPFFIEEMVQALFDEGTLVRNGAVKVTHPLSQLGLPPTVQGILASRIDRLSGEHKQLLQNLAVIGRESPLRLIEQVASIAEPRLERMLADLQAGEFIYEEPADTDVEYTFKHALTQEVAYNSLLIEHRKLLHERAGQALESMFARQLDAHVSELARHYASSGNISKAVEYLGRSGQQAVQLGPRGRHC